MSSRGVIIFSHAYSTLDVRQTPLPKRALGRESVAVHAQDKCRVARLHARIGLARIAGCADAVHLSRPH
jgi:hypothetical protein